MAIRSICYNLLRKSRVVTGNTSTLLGGIIMEFKPIHVQSPTDQFIDQLESAILTGKYQPGDKLPSERELEKQLCVSRPVINAALRKLEALHFVTIQPRNGVYIADYRTAGDLATMNEIINFHDGHYRISLLKSIYRVRLQMEEDIVKLAVTQQDQHELQQAHFALSALANMTTTEAQAVEYFAFIHHLALASQNDVYPLLINNFKSIYLTLGKWTFESETPENIKKQNERLLDLIKDGQPEEAMQYNEQLIGKSYRLLTGKQLVF